MGTFQVVVDEEALDSLMAMETMHKMLDAAFARLRRERECREAGHTVSNGICTRCFLVASSDRAAFM